MCCLLADAVFFGGLIAAILEQAFEKTSDGTGLILHSDRGWQYQHKQYQGTLRKNGVQP